MIIIIMVRFFLLQFLELLHFVEAVQEGLFGLRQIWRRDCWRTDKMLRAINRGLRQDSAALETHKSGRRLGFRADFERRVPEVEPLRSPNGVVTADEDQHLAGCHDALLDTVARLLRRL